MILKLVQLQNICIFSENTVFDVDKFSHDAVNREMNNEMLPFVL